MNQRHGPPAGRLRSPRWTRAIAIAGILWPLLAIARLPLTGELDRPNLSDASSDIVEYYGNSDSGLGFMVGIAMMVLAFLLLLTFVSKVSVLVETDERGARWLGRLIVVLATVWVVLTLGYIVPFATAVTLASGPTPIVDGYLMLHALSFSADWVALPTKMLFGVAFGGAIVATGLFPRWLGWAMIASSMAEAVAFFLPVEAWNVVSGLRYIWILIAAAIMFATPERYSPADAT